MMMKMMSLIALICALLASSTTVSALASSPSGTSAPSTPSTFPIPVPVTTYFTSLIDHFSSPTGAPPATFQQKVLTCSDYWINNGTSIGPVLFYTGNEGEIEDFYAATGIIFEWASKLQALVIFVEHRYFGSSLPYGAQSFTNTNLQYLTIEQALEDYAVFIQTTQVEMGLQNVPWISVGGSYGGVLASWIRLKYPNLISGAIAASSPIKYLKEATDYTYFQAATADFAARSPQCVETVREGYAQLAEMIQQENFAQIQQEWQLCRLPTPETIEHVILWSVNSMLSLAQYDYPYPTTFSGAPLGAFPVNQACDMLTDPSLTPFTALGQAVGLFYNGTGGNLTCYDTVNEFIQCADQTGCGLGNDGTAWDRLVCGQFVYLPNTNGVTDMFPPYQFDYANLTTYCQNTYGVTPNLLSLQTDFGIDSIVEVGTNIVFSNGDLDPFHAGGFLPDSKKAKEVNGVLMDRVGISSSIVRLLIHNGAHHLDLRASNPLDPESVIQAREIELQTIQQWIADYVPINPDQQQDEKRVKQMKQAEAVVDEVTSFSSLVDPITSSTSTSIPTSTVDASQIITTNRHWVHTARASPSQPVQIRLTLNPSDATSLDESFEKTFDPHHTDYLNYPDEEVVKKWLAPSEDVQSQLNSWITSSVCTSSRQSCQMSYTPVKDSLIVKMSVEEMEEWINSNTNDKSAKPIQLHVYTHTQNPERHYIRSSLSSLNHLVPSHLLPHIAHIHGVVNFPMEIRKFGTSHVAEKVRKMSSSAAASVPAIPVIAEETDELVSATASSSFDPPAAPIIVPGGNFRLPELIKVTTGDQYVWIRLLFIYCGTNPVVYGQYQNSSTSNWVQCAFIDSNGDSQTYIYNGITVTLYDLNGEVSDSYNDDQGIFLIQPSYFAGQKHPSIFPQRLQTSYNYAGYTLKITTNWQQANNPSVTHSVSDTYPYRLSPTQMIIPSFIRSFFGLPDDFAASQPSTQIGIGTLVVTGGQGNYNPSDLSSFWNENNIPGSPNAYWKDYSNPKQTNDPTQPDLETQLDIQFGLGMLNSGQASGTIFHVNDNNVPFDDIANAIIALSNTTRPSTLSFSYGGPESENNNPPASIDHTNYLFKTLGLVGVSVFVSSGDTGAFVADPSLTITDMCAAFNPSYPASSPYVTAVGASVLASNSLGECPHVVQSSLEFGSEITGGGGFSQVQPVPAYQQSFLNAYLANKNCSRPTTLPYNITMRMYPDIVAFGHAYQIVNKGVDQSVDGTSASSPTFAGIMTIINEKRALAGMKPLGFLNPLLYSTAISEPRAFIDITQGSNRCLETNIGCCIDGFYACSGPDPVSGLGQPDFRYLAKAFNITLDGTVSDLVQCIPTKSKSKLWIYVGIAIALGIILIAVLVFCVWRHMRKPVGDTTDESGYQPMPESGTGGQGQVQDGKGRKKKDPKDKESGPYSQMF